MIRNLSRKGKEKFNTVSVSAFISLRAVLVEVKLLLIAVFIGRYGHSVNCDKLIPYGFYLTVFVYTASESILTNEILLLKFWWKFLFTNMANTAPNWISPPFKKKRSETKNILIIWLNSWNDWLIVNTHFSYFKQMISIENILIVRNCFFMMNRCCLIKAIILLKL